MWNILPENSINNEKRIAYCYLHGQLENDCKHDVFYLDNCPDLEFRNNSRHYLDIKDGIYPCEYNNIPCTIFLWSGGDGQKGLCVYNNDTSSFNYAQNCFNNKVLSI